MVIAGNLILRLHKIFGFSGFTVIQWLYSISMIQLESFKALWSSCRWLLNLRRIVFCLQLEKLKVAKRLHLAALWWVHIEILLKFHVEISTWSFGEQFPGCCAKSSQIKAQIIADWKLNNEETKTKTLFLNCSLSSQIRLSGDFLSAL